MSAATASIARLVARQHTDLVKTLEGIDVTGWDRASWCQGWTVRDVVVHLAAHIHHEPARAERLRDLAQSRFRPRRAAEQFVVRNRGRSRDELLAWLRQPVEVADGGTDAEVQLAELTIHGEDIRRPLGIEHDVDPEVARRLLDYGLTRIGSVAVAGARRRARGLKLEAPDIGWVHGDGPAVTGPGRSLLLALNGRSPALADLAGSGLVTLASRQDTGR